MDAFGDLANNPVLLVSIYTLGLGLFLAEVFIPSGGILGIAGTLCVGYSIGMLYATGHTTLAICAVFFTIAYAVFVFMWGLRRVTSTESLAESSSTGRDVQAASELIGVEGEAVTALRPAGVAVIRGQRFDVVTRGAFVEVGSSIRVLETQGNRIVVKPV